MPQHHKNRRGRSHGRGRGRRGRGRGGRGRTSSEALSQLQPQDGLRSDATSKGVDETPHDEIRSKDIGQKSAQNATTVDEGLALQLLGSTGLLNLLDDEECPLERGELQVSLRKGAEVNVTDVTGTGNGRSNGMEVRVACRLPSWEEMENTVRWFRGVVEVDPQASMEMSPALFKERRAEVHDLVKMLGDDILQSVSSGFGEERRLKILRSDSEAARQKASDGVASPELLDRARLLWQWALQENESLSRDEAVEVLIALEKGEIVPARFVKIWNRRWPLQHVAEQLCAAVSENDASRLRDILMAHPDVIRQGVINERNGEGCLHIAAGEGHLECLEILLESGYPVDAEDGSGETAMEVARRNEQCDAQGILLRAGSKAAEEENGILDNQNETLMSEESEPVETADAYEGDAMATKNDEGSVDIGHVSTASVCGTERSELLLREAEVFNSDAGFETTTSSLNYVMEQVEDSPSAEEEELAAALVEPDAEDEEAQKDDDAPEKVKYFLCESTTNDDPSKSPMERASGKRQDPTMWYRDWTDWFPSHKVTLLIGIGAIATGAFLWRGYTSKYRLFRA